MKNINIYKLTEKQKRNFFDEATELAETIEKFGYTQEEIAEKTGRAQSTIANKLRLLRLTDEERKIIIANNLTERHARSLLKIASPSERIKVLKMICDENYNVEESEKYIATILGKTTIKSYKKRKKSPLNVTKLICVINRAVDNIKYSGVTAVSEKIENDNFIEYRVKIPYVKQKIN